MNFFPTSFTFFPFLGERSRTSFTFFHPPKGKEVGKKFRGFNTIKIIYIYLLPFFHPLPPSRWIFRPITAGNSRLARARGGGG